MEGLALTLAEGVHELLELGGALDLEENLVVVVGDLDVQVLGLLRLLILLGGRRRWRCRHGGGLGNEGWKWVGEWMCRVSVGGTVLHGREDVRGVCDWRLFHSGRLRVGLASFCFA